MFSTYCYAFGTPKNKDKDEDRDPEVDTTDKDTLALLAPKRAVIPELKGDEDEWLLL
jgi:hypothetical protein